MCKGTGGERGGKCAWRAAVAQCGQCPDHGKGWGGRRELKGGQALLVDRKGREVPTRKSGCLLRPMQSQCR